MSSQYGHDDKIAEGRGRPKVKAKEHRWETNASLGTGPDIPHVSAAGNDLIQGQEFFVFFYHSLPKQSLIYRKLLSITSSITPSQISLPHRFHFLTDFTPVPAKHVEPKLIFASAASAACTFAIVLFDPDLDSYPSSQEPKAQLCASCHLRPQIASSNLPSSDGCCECRA